MVLASWPICRYHNCWFHHCRDIRSSSCSTGINNTSETGGKICRRCRWYQWQICRRCRWYRWFTLTCEYLRDFSKKIETVLMVYFWAGGKLIHEKKQKQKSRDTVPLITFGFFVSTNCIGPFRNIQFWSLYTAWFIWFLIYSVSFFLLKNIYKNYSRIIYK